MGLRYLLAIGIICIAGTYAADVRHGRAAAEGVPGLGGVPAQTAGWTSRDYEQTASAAEVLRADARLRRVYSRADGADVDVTLIYFAQQQVNSQIHSPKNCIPGGGWKIDWVRNVGILINGRTVPVTRMRIHRGDRALDVCYWFKTRSGPVAGEYALKWDLVRNSLLNRQTNAAMIRFSAGVEDSTAARELMSLLDPAVNDLLGSVGL